MLRPNFVRSQVGDIEMFERHVRNVFAAIPRDGSVMKLHDVFFGMTLDVATDFLFGESLGCLEPGGGNEEAEGFVSAFTYAQNMLEGQAGDWGILSLFLPNKKLKRAYQTLHGRFPFARHFCLSLLSHRELQRPKYATIQPSWTPSSKKP